MCVIHYFILFGVGGSEYYAYYLCKELSKNHDVIIFFTTSEDGNKGSVLKGDYDGIAYWALKKDRMSYSHPFHDRNRWVEEEFTKVVEQFKPDIIHFQHLINLSFKLPSLAKQRGIPSCMTLHDFWFLCPRTIFLTAELKLCTNHSPRNCLDCLEGDIEYYPERSKVNGLWRTVKEEIKKVLNCAKKTTVLFSLALWRPYWIKKVFKDVDLFIAPSQFLLEKYVHNGIDREKIALLRHGFNKDDFSGVRAACSPKMRFGFVGTIRAHKGIYLLIDAFNKITGNAELKIYGRVTSALLEDLKKRIVNPNIHIMGELHKEDKRKAFSEIDVLIVPSICYENSPLTISEAFLSKIPVITSNIGGMAELVKDGEYGFTFPVGNAEQLQEKIQLFINDPELRDNLAANLPEVNDIKTHAKELVNMYHDVIKCSKSLPAQFKNNKM
jgi:glycosyltransferase involved in cell wall biosynthesis